MLTSCNELQCPVPPVAGRFLLLCAIIAAMIRRTKIVATLGPATDDPKVLKEMIDAGLDVARINFSHGAQQDHRARIEALRAAAAECGR